MDPISLLVFALYTLFILMILVYVSPLLSAVLMLLVPVSFVYFMPGTMVEFLEIEQFSTIQPVFNFHVLLMIWSALIGIIAYSEILSWYLLKETVQKKQQPAPSQVDISLKNKILEFYKRIRKNISSEK